MKVTKKIMENKIDFTGVKKITSTEYPGIIFNALSFDENYIMVEDEGEGKHYGAIQIAYCMPYDEKENTLSNRFPTAYTPEMESFLLTVMLRLTTEEQRARLCFDLYSRNGLQKEIDKKIIHLKTQKLINNEDIYNKANDSL